jgi:hypothetical protein
MQRLVLVGVFIIIIFPYIGNFIIPTDFHNFPGVGLPPTRVWFPSFPSPGKNRGLSKLKPDFFCAWGIYVGWLCPTPG